MSSSQRELQRIEQKLPKLKDISSMGDKGDSYMITMLSKLINRGFTIDQLSLSFDMAVSDICILVDKYYREEDQSLLLENELKIIASQITTSSSVKASDKISVIRYLDTHVDKEKVSDSFEKVFNKWL